MTTKPISNTPETLKRELEYLFQYFQHALEKSKVKFARQAYDAMIEARTLKPE